MRRDENVEQHRTTMQRVMTQINGTAHTQHRLYHVYVHVHERLFGSLDLCICTLLCGAAACVAACVTIPHLSERAGPHVLSLTGVAGLIGLSNANSAS